MSNWTIFLRSRTGITFLALLLTLAVGIAIGTLVSIDVSSAKQSMQQVAQLKVEGDGDPVIVREEFSLREGFAKVAGAIEPAVVNISTQSVIERRARQTQPGQDPFRDFFGDDFWQRFFGPDSPQRQKRTSLGSGVIVDSKGYLLTNYHVVAPLERRDGSRQLADKIEVQLHNGNRHVAEVVGIDPESDLAVLRIRSNNPLPFAKVGDSTKLNVGDWVLAVGSPFGLTQTVTAGIVSATKRVVQTGIFGDYIQTDAAINPGNSGGPLVNMNGEIIGINSFITTSTGTFNGVGFAIPSSVFVNSYNQLVTTGKIERGWLGVSMNVFPMTPEMAKHFGVAGDEAGGLKDGTGVLVTQLIDERGDPADTGPAAKAGIKPGDVIVKFGDRKVEQLWDLRVAVANAPPGQKVPVVVVRDGEILNLEVELAERTIEERQRQERETFSLDQEEPEERPKEIGIEFQTLNPRDAKQAGLEDETGVQILSVTPGSLADDAGLEARQIITHVNGQSVGTAQQFRQMVTAVPSGQGIVLRIVDVDTNGRKLVNFTSFIKP